MAETLSLYALVLLFVGFFIWSLVDPKKKTGEVK